MLDDRVLSPAGIEFARRHYAAFEAFARTELPHPVEDKWSHYDQVAPWLTARYLGPAAGRRGPVGRFRRPRPKQKFEWRPWKWRR